MADRGVIRQALKLAGLKKGNVFYDLGCGNGDVLIEAAKMGAKAEGYEISPHYYLLAKIRTQKYKNIKIIFSNIYSTNFARADVIYCYLLPEMLEKLAPKFRNEMEKGSRLISIGFPIKTFKKGTEYNINGRKIFIYTTKVTPTVCNFYG